MLLELHVRNLALIEQADVEFGEGLNILTGETGAGKSIIIGSVNLALGQKVPKDIIRSGADSAWVELVFSVDEEKRKGLAELEVYPDEDGLLIITRKILPARSISRINDETVTAAKLRKVTGLLIDIHGQHEHQSLLHASKHLEILDIYAKSKTCLLYTSERKLLEAKHRLALAGGRLHGLSPLAKISKGFGFLTDQSEKRIESIKAVQPGDRITIRISDGELKAQVTGTRELGSNAGV